MLSLAEESTNIEETQPSSLLDNAVTIVQDRSSTLYLEQDPAFDLPIFLEVSTVAQAHDLKTLKQFQNRTQAVVKLQHPHIVPILDIGTTPDNHFYTAIEHFSSITLTQRLIELKRSQAKLSPEEVLTLANKLADALGSVHALNIIHQDLRPEKILLNAQGEPLLAGFTVINSPVLTRDTIRDLMPVNELDFESPEQAMGEEVTAVSNIYSLGILIYTLFTGHPPRLPIGQWQVDDSLQASREIPLSDARPGLAKETYELVQKCIASDPAKRYQTIEALQADIQMAMMAEQVNTDQQVVQLTKTTPKSFKRPRWVVATIALLSIALIAVAAIFFMSGPPTDTEATNASGSSDEVAAVAITDELTITATATVDAAATAVIIAEQQTATAEALAASATKAANEAMIEATAEAEMIAATEAAMVEPTATEMPSPTPTIEPTAVVVEEPACEPQATILVAYPHEDPEHNLTHTNIFFPLNFDFKNSGDCPIPTGAQLVHVSGEAFGHEGDPVTLDSALASNQAHTLRVVLSSPEEAGEYTSTWQLIDSQENPISDPFTFQVRTYVPEEGTGEDATAETTTTVVETLALDWLYTVDGDSCELVDQDWRCPVNITPYGGTGGPYQLLVFDQPAGQATTFEGIGSFTYHAVSARCDTYSQQLKIIDQVTGNNITSQLTIDPNSFFDCN